jgi:CHAP domain
MVTKPPVIPEWHGAAVGPGRQGGGRKVRRALVAGAGLGVVALVLSLTLPGIFGHNDSYPMPSVASLAGLTVPQRIVAIAQSQVGYTTNPSNSYCNKFSAYWDAGQNTCPSGLTSEEWCADFAAWAWREAGLSFSYGYGPGEINGAAVSYYEWAVANGEWHPAGSGYVASPGDVAVYGLLLGTDPSAAHVAVVTADAPGQSGPDVVNGDGDQTGFSVVEAGTNQLQIHIGQDAYDLAGYVSPP